MQICSKRLGNINSTVLKHQFVRKFKDHLSANMDNQTVLEFLDREVLSMDMSAVGVSCDDNYTRSSLVSALGLEPGLDTYRLGVGQC